MFTQLLWWSGNLLMTTILARSSIGGFFRKYVIFYVYLGWVLLDSLVSFYVYVVNPGAYVSLYWYTEFLSLALGYTVIWEISRQALADYPGVGRMARTVLLFFFVMVLARALTGPLGDQASYSTKLLALLERDLRAVQALLLAGIVGLLAYYRIPVGLNLKGMTLGYGVFVGASVINLTLGSYLGDQFQPWWQYLQPTAYFLGLLIWTTSLWAYHPNPRPAFEVELEGDYELLRAHVGKAVTGARGYLLRAVRP